MSTVDIVVCWANTAIAVERLAERDTFTIGAAASSDHHFVCEHPAIPAPRFALVDNRDGVRMCAPSRA